MLTDLLLAGLATWQIVEIEHHARIARRLRVWAAWHAHGRARRGLAAWPLLAAYVLRCPFCLSLHVATACTLLLCLASVADLPWLRYVLCVPAASRLANLANDWTADRCRTPKTNENDFDEEKLEYVIGHDQEYNSLSEF